MTNKDLKRMIDLMGIKKPINEQISNSAVELKKKSPNGKVYGIVRENRKYFIKESTDGINYEYIGGLGNKTKNQYSSYEEAVKRLNIMFEDFNRTYGVRESNDILSSDIITEKKFVLKSKKKKSTPAPAEEESFGETEEGGEDFDFGGGEETETEEGDEDFDFGGGEETETEEGDDFGGEEEETEEDEEFDEEDEDYDLEDDPIKDIQRMTGKLGQKIRDTEDLSSDTMKWVAKSVISALDLENMDSNDKRDIIRSVKKRKNKSSDEESDFMNRGKGRQSCQECGPMSYMVSNKSMVSWDDLSEEEKEEIISGMNNGIGGDETEPIEVMRGTEKVDLILDDEDDNVDYMSHGLPNEGPFGEIEKVDGGYDLYISNNIDVNDIPEHFSVENIGDPIFYSEEEVDTLKTDIKELNTIVKGENEDDEDYMYRYDEDYMNYLEMKNPGTKEREKTKEKEKTEKDRKKNPFKRPERINPDEEPAKARYDEYGDYGYGTEEGIDYMGCPVCGGRNPNCNSCSDRNIFNRNESNYEVDEPYTKGVDYSDNSQYSLRKRIMNSMMESMKNPGTKEREKTKEKEKEKTREKNPFKRPERINPDEEPAKAKNPGTKEREKTKEKEKTEKDRKKNPFKRPERINPDEEPAKAKYKKK